MAEPVSTAEGLRRFAWLAAAGFLLHGNWEWLQTPFYSESEAVVTIVWYRLHCTIIDVGILLGAAVAVTALRRSLDWLVAPRRLDLALVGALGVGYTAISEQVNVAIEGTWTYSELMPVIPGSAIGAVPLLQWALLAPLAVLLATRLASRPLDRR